MYRRVPWPALAALALAGCGDDSAAPPDGAGDTAAEDAAVPVEDAGDADASDAPDDGAPDESSGEAETSVGRSCADPDPAWLLCEDFERGGGDWDAWAAGGPFLDSPGFDDRGRVRLSADEPHGGAWSVLMPAEAGSGYRGASLDWWACEGEPRAGCPLRSFDALYFRAWVRFAPDHRYVHHFLNVGGSQPDDFWYHGTAGCLPNGALHMGTTVDFHEETHAGFFYTYFPEMTCDTRCERYADVDAICAGCLERGLPTCEEQPQCCWGNEFAPDPPVALPVGRWFCLELMMRANSTDGATMQHDGEMAYWVDGTLAHRVEGMAWRLSPTLALNRARLQHYIETEDADGFSNRVWFDDVVVSTAPIGCD